MNQQATVESVSPPQRQGVRKRYLSVKTSLNDAGWVQDTRDALEEYVRFVNDLVKKTYFFLKFIFISESTRPLQAREPQFLISNYLQNSAFFLLCFKALNDPTATTRTCTFFFQA
ncbi:hypothetical protein DM01DRAFT_1339068 [Hesseltinella vesiculosa]|uniref:Uncharacterized protein n=1 Tax=Hesseltinella vesiculosa TaxID=101127 RepID=A0A1X2G837_9FUNG|nr:hypothetical protein DM01DRAFT_1339068 [Hesseltinella vesiculosa]